MMGLKTCVMPFCWSWQIRFENHEKFKTFICTKRSYLDKKIDGKLRFEQLRENAIHGLSLGLTINNNVRFGHKREMLFSAALYRENDV
jgi:hypothetical protein